jgi:hypothetical protein
VDGGHFHRMVHSVDEIRISGVFEIKIAHFPKAPRRKPSASIYNL